jgi:hypothetical protein
MFAFPPALCLLSDCLLSHNLKCGGGGRVAARGFLLPVLFRCVRKPCEAHLNSLSVSPSVRTHARTKQVSRASRHGYWRSLIRGGGEFQEKLSRNFNFNLGRTCFANTLHEHLRVFLLASRAWRGQCTHASEGKMLGTQAAEKYGTRIFSSVQFLHNYYRSRYA